MEERSKNPKWRWLSKLFSWANSNKNSRRDGRVVAETPLQTTVNPPQCKISSVNKPSDNSRALKVVAICGSLRKASCNRGLIRAAIEIAKESIPGMEIELLDISNLPFLNTDLEVKGRFPQAVEEFRKGFLGADCILFSSPEYNYSVTAIEIANELIPGMEIEMLDIGNLPFSNTELEVEERFPQAVDEFRKGFLGADCILFSYPEDNYSVTGPLKNAIDWASRHPNVMAGKPAAIMSVAGFLGGARGQYHLRQIGVYLDIHFINKPEVFVSGSQPPMKFDENGNLIDEATRERVERLLHALHSFAIKLID